MCGSDIELCVREAGLAIWRLVSGVYVAGDYSSTFQLKPWKFQRPH